MESLLGRTLSHYRITGQLGSGGMGHVYEAEDTRLGRMVAVKVFSEARRGDVSSQERFMREARAASALNHPGICTVHAIEPHGGHDSSSWNCLEGQTLASRLERVRPGLPRSWNWAFRSPTRSRPPTPRASSTGT